MYFRIRATAAAVAIACCGPALCQTAALNLGKVTVIGQRDPGLPTATEGLAADDIAARRPYVSDTAQLFSDIPGVSLYSGGGVSSLPVIRGLNDDRIRVRIDGMDLTSACGNHMNPPLSYIDPANIERALLIAGITPVSLGGDSIAGTIVIDSRPPAFAKPGEDVQTHASLSGFYRSNGSASGVSAAASAAFQNIGIAFTGATARSGNYHAGDGTEVKSSRYETGNNALSIAARGAAGLIVVNVGQQRIPEQGYPNARMDMVDNQAVFGNLRYEGQFGWGKLEARAFYEHTRHEMNFLPDKLPGDMPMKTNGRNAGYRIAADVPVSATDLLRIGTEWQRFVLDDWWPASATGGMMMGPGTFENINDGRRDRLGLFAEWDVKWSSQWSSLLGARFDRVSMNTGAVRPYDTNPANSMQAADIAAASAFNARDHRRTDNNVDLVALARYVADQNTTIEAGLARKTRSPNLYERYTWGRGAMAMNMTGWFGDANGYVGNLDLKPEVASTLSATLGWHDAAQRVWDIKVTPYVTWVKDYIDADRCLSARSMSGTFSGCPLNGSMAQTATDKFVYLQFANHRARLYGVDVAARAALAHSALGEFSARGTLGYLRGTNLDTGESLYHMMPLNAKFAIDHALGSWSSSIELQAVAAKDRVQATRNETTTAGYGLVNLRSRYQWQQVRVDAGIENLFDRNYDLPLGGAYVGERSMQSWGQRVAGAGRTAYVSLTVGF